MDTTGFFFSLKHTVFLFVFKLFLFIYYYFVVNSMFQKHLLQCMHIFKARLHLFTDTHLIYKYSYFAFIPEAIES